MKLHGVYNYLYIKCFITSISPACPMILDLLQSESTISIYTAINEWGVRIRTARAFKVK